jgi:hypothetical protein
MVQLPEVHVKFYENGPVHPETPVQKAAERNFREAYYAAAWEASRMGYVELIDAEVAAWEERQAVRERSEVLVTTAQYYNIPDPSLDGLQAMYVKGHELDAARARGRHQALDLAKRFCGDLIDDEVPEEVIQSFVLQPWARSLEPWATTELDKLVCPSSPHEFITADQRQILKCFKTPAVEKQIASKLLIRPQYRCAQDLMTQFPRFKDHVIDGLLRRGETMNVIAPPKYYKSWMVTDLGLSVTTGRDWLDTFPTVKGRVLLIDNELHPETSAHRIPKVAMARGIPMSEFGERFFVENLRGRLTSLLDLDPYFECIDPGYFSMIILDALYRFIPSDSSENDNSMVANIYSRLDQIAARLACAIVCIHHASKGIQSGKSVTDVGAGAGSQARAADTHLILRPHEVPDAVVLDAAVRSWPPIEPICLRWQFPLWIPDHTLDPTALRPERPRRRQRPAKEPKPEPVEWTSEQFVEKFITAEPQGIDAIYDPAGKEGLSKRKAKELLRQAQDDGTVHRWKYGSNKPFKFATTPQPEEEE